MVARIGGDEFVILLPNADAVIANLALERINRNVQQNNKENNELDLSISYSASTGELGQELRVSITQADQNGYNEKNRKKLG